MVIGHLQLFTIVKKKKCTNDTYTMMFTADLQIYPQVNFPELYFLDPMVYLLFRISDTLYKFALLKSCTDIYFCQQCMSGRAGIKT